MCYGNKTWSEESLMWVYNDDDLHGGQRSSEVKCATPLYMLLTKFGQNPIINVEGVANCQKERKKEEETRHDCALCKGTS